MTSGLWPKTRRAWTYVVVFAALFLVLDVLALMGFEFAIGLLATLGGGLAGVLLAGACPLVRGLPRESLWRPVWMFAGIASTFGIVVAGSALAGSALAGIPLFPTAEGGYTGAFVYGLAIGFGGTVVNFSLGDGARSASPGAEEEDRNARIKTVLVVVGATLGLLAVCFAGYLAIEYVLAPIARSFL
jgi:hypothetical protein